MRIRHASLTTKNDIIHFKKRFAKGKPKAISYCYHKAFDQNSLNELL